MEQARTPDGRVGAAIAASHLRSLPGSLVAELTTGAHLHAVDRGAVIHREGDSAPHLELVVSGLVRVFVTATDGRTLTIRYVRTGGMLGAVSLFASSFALPGTIQAITAAERLVFDPRVVRRAADSDVRVARALIDELSERVMSFLPEIPGSAFTTVRQRVARHLLDLASTSSSDPPRAETSQQQLADAVGTVREVVVRALRDLRAGGLVVTGRGGVAILDVEGLAVEAHGWVHAGHRTRWNPGS